MGLEMVVCPIPLIKNLFKEIHQAIRRERDLEGWLLHRAKQFFLITLGQASDSTQIAMIYLLFTGWKGSKECTVYIPINTL